jgi:hypothetical protein
MKTQTEPEKGRGNDRPKQFKFKVNDQSFESEQSVLTGAQIKAQAQMEPSFQLFLEEPGDDKPDRQIGDTETVDLSEPGIEKFYGIPPATFGATHEYRRQSA